MHGGFTDRSARQGEFRVFSKNHLLSRYRSGFVDAPTAGNDDAVFRHSDGCICKDEFRKTIQARAIGRPMATLRARVQ